MRKLFFLLLIAIAVLFSSCQSSVGISYMVPSEIDMGNYRNIALASTVPYDAFIKPSRYIRTVDFIARQGFGYVLSSYGWDLKDDVASYATERIMSTLSDSGYFSILPPSVTDKILSASSIGISARDEFARRGIDAVIIPRIDNMSVDEYVYSRTRVEERTDRNGKKYETEVTDFYYDADYYLTLSYTIVDAKSERIVATRKFVVDDSDNFRLSGPYFLSNYPLRSFKNMIDSTMSRITRQLVPLRTSVSITLMDNKPESERAKAAYEAVDDGNYTYAATLFYDNFKASGHVPSGYNAALVTAATGDIESAISIADDVYAKSGNSEVSALRSRLISIKQSNEESIRQIEGSSSPSSSSSYGLNLSIYDTLLR